MSTQSSQFMSFLHDVMEASGAMAMDYRSRLGSLSMEFKNTKDDKDIVTEADCAIEDYLRERISERFPEHAVLGEEQGHTGDSDYCWVIDPIDGTESFVHGQPFFSVSIGLQHQGETIAAGVEAPVLGERFTAEKGQGAFRGGKPMRVSAETQSKRCILGTGFACLRSNWAHNNLAYINYILPQIRDLRRYGSAAIDLSMVACGALDGFWELNLNAYDIAAGMLLVSEAGGQVSDFAGAATGLPKEIVATNGHVHDQVVTLLSDAKVIAEDVANAQSS